MSNACDSIVSGQVVVNPVRQRVSVDLGSLGPKAHAYAAARGLALSALMRLAVTALLEESPDPVASGSAQGTGLTHTKLTLRLRCDAAQVLAHRAKSSGLSHGGYVTMLLNGMNPASAEDHASAVDALGRSTAWLAPALADLRNALRCAGSPMDGPSVQQIDVLAQAVHRHLLSASTLLAELRPAAAARRR